MKAILLLLSSLILVLGVFLSGVMLSAYFIAEPEVHKFAHLDTPDLWTSHPVKVDPTIQSYQREPGPVLAADVRASDIPDELVMRRSVEIPVGDGVDAPSIDVASAGNGVVASGSQAVQLVDTAQAKWCLARYRSYTVEDNSYQPLDGGPRRQCAAPGSAVSGHSDGALQLVADRGTEAQPALAVAEPDRPANVGNPIYGSNVSAGVSGSHAEWCLARYRSYRMDDNSYQPFDGGPRKTCQSPFG